MSVASGEKLLNIQRFSCILIGCIFYGTCVISLEYSLVFAMIFDWIVKLGNLTSTSNKVSKKNYSCSPNWTVYSSSESGISVKDGAY